MSFPRYPRYKDSGVEWLGEVPQHWGVQRLSPLTSKITNGYVGPTRDILVDEGVRYLQSLHIKGNRIRFDVPYFVSREWSNQHGKSILQSGDVLIVQTGDIGQAAVVPPDFAGCNCHALIVVTPDTKAIDGEWLSWLLNSDYGYHSLLSIQTGALHPHLNCGDVKDIVIPVPPSSDQVLIKSFLDRETVKIDGLVAEQRRLIELLQEKRQALISHAVTKGLNPNARMKPSGIEWLGDVPEHWDVKRLGWISSEINDINHEMPAAVESGVPFLSAKDLLDDGTLNFSSDIKMISEEDFVKLSMKIRPHRGDIIYSRIGACLGKARLVETDERFLVSYSCCVVRIKQTHALGSFIQHVLDGEMILTEARMRTQGIGVPDLGLREISRFPIPLPPIQEQRVIAEFLTSEVRKLAELTAEGEKSIRLLQERRMTLISAAVTGKIDVSGLVQTVSA